MITELMIVLIAVGAGIIFIVWLNSRRRHNQDLEQQEIEESTGKFKKDLENTANEIIGRMQEQASNLENLLDHSERNQTQLEGRVSELKKLLKKSEGQSTEIKDLLARLDDAVDDINLMQQQMDLVERKINAAINLPMQQIPQMVTPPPLINPMMQNQTNAAATFKSATKSACAVNRLKDAGSSSSSRNFRRVCQSTCSINGRCSSTRKRSKRSTPFTKNQSASPYGKFSARTSRRKCSTCRRSTTISCCVVFIGETLKNFG